MLILAYGDKYYLRAAFALLCSIRAYYPTTMVHLEYDSSWTELSPEDTQMVEAFDSFGRRIQFNRAHIYLPKLSLDQWTPFERTLYIDADALIFPAFPGECKNLVKQYEKIYPAFLRLNSDIPIPAINGLLLKSGQKKGGPIYHFHGVEDEIMKYYDLEVLPSTSTGIVYFEKNMDTWVFFMKARQIYHDPFAPAFSLPENTGRADEFPFNVLIGIKVKDSPVLQKFQPMHFHRIGLVCSLDAMRASGYIGIQLGTHRLPEFVTRVADTVLTDVYTRLSIPPELRFYNFEKRGQVAWRNTF